jgi:hypothetical protein
MSFSGWQVKTAGIGDMQFEAHDRARRVLLPADELAQKREAAWRGQ